MSQYPIQHHVNPWTYLFVLLAGALTVFAFAPFEIYPLAWLTPAVLFYALSKAQTPKQYFYLGWLFGIGLFGAGASWPFYSMYYFAHAPLPMALSATALFVIIIALFSTALFGWLASLFRSAPLLTRLLLFYPAGWVLLEWFRGWFLTGFPWLYLGNSQIDTVFAGLAPITGVLGLSWICVLIAGALVSFVVGNSAHRRVAAGQDVNRHMLIEERFGASSRIFSLLLIVLLAALSWSLGTLNWTSPKGKAFSASVLQGNVSQTDKLNPDNLQSMIALYREMTQQAADSDLIVWPETALFSTFNNHMDDLLIPLQKTLENKNSAAELHPLAGKMDSTTLFQYRRRRQRRYA